MALGRFSDVNLIETATLAGGQWSPVLPLANVKGEGRYVSEPARQLFPNDPTKARIEATLAEPRTVNLIALLFHTLGVNAEYRVTIAGPEGNLAAPDYQGDWTPVHGRMFPSQNLAWEEPNWWLGTGSPEDILLYPRHLWIVLKPGVPTAVVRVELRDPDAAFFDIGGMWVCGAWSPAFNFDHGRELGSEARSLSDEALSGLVYHEDRQARRRLTVTWSMLEPHEGLKLFDAGTRCGTRRPVLMLPDADDPVSLIREAWPATFEKPPAFRRSRRFQNSVSATFREIIA